MPRTAVAAATSGDTRCVRPPLPWRPSKLRLEVDALRSPGASWSGFMPRHIEQPDVELLWKLLENEPGTEVTVDLREKTVQAADLTVPFEIDEYTRWRLLEGLDDIGLTLRHADRVAAFETARPARLPVTTPR